MSSKAKLSFCSWFSTDYFAKHKCMWLWNNHLLCFRLLYTCFFYFFIFQGFYTCESHVLKVNYHCEDMAWFSHIHVNGTSIDFFIVLNASFILQNYQLKRLYSLCFHDYVSFQTRQHLSTFVSTQKPTFVVVQGFIFSSYGPKCHFWEMLQKQMLELHWLTTITCTRSFTNRKQGLFFFAPH